MYRQHAEELRTTASGMGSRINRDTLLKFAEEYDRMAENPVENLPKKLRRTLIKPRYGDSDFNL